MKPAVISKLKNDIVVKAVFDAVDTTRAKAYLVGGIVRNLVLSRPFGFDYDIALDGKIKDIANLLAERFKGSPFLLDKESGAYRVVVKSSSEFGVWSSELKSEIHIDLSPFKGNDILEDLSNRDFTINAMAVDVAALFREKKTSLIDIFKGRADAKNKTIRMIKPKIFDDDPLRLLRAIRLSAQYGLIIDKETERCIKKKSGLLAKSSWERIRDEFFAILEITESVSYMKRLYELSLLQKIIPETKEWESKTSFPTLAGYNLLRHAFKTLEQGEKLYNNLKTFMPEFAGNIENSFQMQIGSVSKKGLFKLALLIHDAGKPATMQHEGKRIRFIGHEVEGEPIGKRIARRLKLSRAASAFTARLVRNHHRVFNLASIERVTDRSKAHLFRATSGEDGIALSLLSLADARATRNGDDPELALFVKNLISFYYKIYAVSKPNPILNGNEVMEIFGLSEGIMVGRILRKLAEAEGEGVIKNKRDAVKFIKDWLAKTKEG
ncbi:MAG: CCA tRNA nucleotidyltransferase [Deltaproteobacteria bacterium]|nr:CCA tRNA nucleotidyltransferase [Deltaproteobacteria bacterium]